MVINSSLSVFREYYFCGDLDTFFTRINVCAFYRWHTSTTTYLIQSGPIFQSILLVARGQHPLPCIDKILVVTTSQLGMCIRQVSVVTWQVEAVGVVETSTDPCTTTIKVCNILFGCVCVCCSCLCIHV